MPLTKQGQNSQAGATVTIPAHTAGDLIVIAAYRDGSTAVPTKPTASGTVPAWVDITAAAGANTNSLRTACFVATASNHTSGTWTNATGMAAIVFRGQKVGTGIASIGGKAQTDGMERRANGIHPRYGCCDRVSDQHEGRHVNRNGRQSDGNDDLQRLPRRTDRDPCRTGQARRGVSLSRRIPISHWRHVQIGRRFRLCGCVTCGRRSSAGHSDFGRLRLSHRSSFPLGTRNDHPPRFRNGRRNRRVDRCGANGQKRLSIHLGNRIAGSVRNDYQERRGNRLGIGRSLVSGLRSAVGLVIHCGNRVPYGRRLSTVSRRGVGGRNDFGHRFHECGRLNGSFRFRDGDGSRQTQRQGPRNCAAAFAADSQRYSTRSVTIRQFIYRGEMIA
jgi:hypothetical protein